MTPLQSKTLNAVKQHIPTFDSLPNGEKVLQIMAYLADVIKVREELGNNHGKFVDDFLEEAGGLGAGYAWCTASLNWCLECLGIPNPDKSDAAVIGWYNWAKANDRLYKNPARGRLCLYLHADNTGHIGIVVSFDDEIVRSIEGNTSSGNTGSQRDGDGLFRRARVRSTWKFYIDIN